MLVSVVLLTYNGAVFIRDVLKEILKQKELPDEIIIIDSGSTDQTVSIINQISKKTELIRLIGIPKQEFGHGRTRNLGASLVKGDIIVYLTQDAVPANAEWLGNLIHPFRENPAVACVFGRQLPREVCSPIIKRDIINHFNWIGTEEYVFQSIEWNDLESSRTFAEKPEWYCFNSNVNSAVRKSVWQEIPFQDVFYAEDQLFGKDIIQAGYTKVYARKASVYHSHHYSLLGFFKRYFDEYRGLKITLGYTEKLGFIESSKQIIKSSKNDIHYILTTEKKSRIKWIFFTPFYHLARRLGAFLGGKHYLIPRTIQKRISLEKRA